MLSYIMDLATVVEIGNRQTNCCRVRARSNSSTTNKNAGAYFVSSALKHTTIWYLLPLNSHIEIALTNSLTVFSQSKKWTKKIGYALLARAHANVTSVYLQNEPKSKQYAPFLYF